MLMFIMSTLRDFRTFVYPLTELMKKGVPERMSRTEEHENIFIKLIMHHVKHRVYLPQFLTIHIPLKPMIRVVVEHASHNEMKLDYYIRLVLRAKN